LVNYHVRKDVDTIEERCVKLRAWTIYTIYPLGVQVRTALGGVKVCIRLSLLVGVGGYSTAVLTVRVALPALACEIVFRLCKNCGPPRPAPLGLTSCFLPHRSWVRNESKDNNAYQDGVLAAVVVVVPSLSFSSKYRRRSSNASSAERISRPVCVPQHRRRGG